jgi:PAS domain S-box-containing protein
MKVLVVEDNEDNRNLLVKQLSAYGHEVAAAVDGVDALEKALEAPPDILVSDILMPRMDGYQLCYEWKQNKRLKDIPFVFCTASYTSGEDEKFGLSLGASLFIRKPIEPEALARILSQAFEQAKEGLLPAAEAALPKLSLYLTEYNKRLVAKLNDKVAELEESEEELRYLSSVLGAIRNINQLIVRERDRTKLLRGACRILHKVREYRFVWVGLIEEGHKRVIPVARAGVEDGYLDSVEISWDDRPSGRGPTGTAIKTGKPDLVKNISEDPRAILWREEALKRGYRSAAAIPLIHGDRVYGALNFYSSQPDGFSDAEVGLLVEVSGDLGFALEAIERQEARWRAEEALRESEAFQSGLLANSPIPICVVNPDSSVRFVNPALVKLTGFSAAELTGEKAPYCYWAEESLTQTMKGFKKAMRYGGDRTPELFKRKNGERFWVEITSVPVKKDGKLQYLLTHWVDITARKRAEEALRESEERFRSIVENSQSGIMILDAAYHLTYANDELCRMSGYSRKELIGQDFRQFLDEESQKLIADSYIRRQRGEEIPPRYEFDIVRKDGQERRVEISSAVIGDSAGEVKTVAQILDITERKRAEEALRESEAFQSGLLANSPIPISVVNPDGSLRYVSPALERLTGYSAKELIGRKPPYPYWPEEKRQEVMKGFKRAMRQGGRGVEELYKNKSGEKFWVELTTTPVRKDGKFQYLLANWVDITERKKAEEALRDEATRRRILIDQSSDGIVILDQDGKIYEANQRFAEMLGYTPEEARELHVWDFEAQLNREQVAEMIASIGPEGDHFETRHRRKDDTTIDVEISANGAICSGQKLIFCVCREITERKQAEAALRESEEKFSKVFSSSSNAICITSLEDGKFIEANDSFTRFTGYTREEVIGSNTAELDLWVNKEELQHWLNTLKENGEVLNQEFHSRMKSGKIRVGLASAETINIGGDPCRITVIADITERKQAEEALTDEATRHHILIDESSDGIVILDEKGKVFEANRRFAEMLGYTLEEVSELHLWDWDAHFKREQLDDMVASVGPEGDHFETQHRRKDSTIFDVEISTNGAVYAGQKLIFCVCRDVTARKRAEEALRESEEKYKTLVETTSDIIWEVDRDGWFSFVSPKIKDLLGYEADEVVGKKRTLDLIAKGEFRRLLRRFKEINAKREPFFGLEIPHLHKNGSLVTCEVSGIPLLDSAGNFKGYVGIDKDITERRQMQEQLVIADRLASVGELAAGIAHELNNPLTSVIGFSQLLLDKEMSDDVMQDIKVVYSEAQRASQVVKNLLTFARRHTAAKEMLNLNDIINKVLELRAYEQNLESIIVDARLDSNLPEIMADYFQLQQVFLNIIINAEYFMKETHHKGKLTITTEKVGNKVKASFADDGPGIDNENLGHLFDPFFTTKEVGRGTGLGLSICHGIVAEHGGRIYVESELGKGATFIVELPIGAAERKRSAA